MQHASEKDLVVNSVVMDQRDNRLEHSLTNDGMYTLVLREVASSDSGYYVCREKNGLGTMHVYYLHVFGKCLSCMYVVGEFGLWNFLRVWMFELKSDKYFNFSCR